MSHTTVKISQLPSASSSDITSATAVLPIIDGNTTKQITVDNLFGTVTNITASGDISASGTITGGTGSFVHLTVDTISPTAIIGYGGDITLDSVGGIILDSHAGSIAFQDEGSNQLGFDMDSTAGAQIIKLFVSGDDLIFKNVSDVSLLTLKHEGQTEIHGNLTASGDISSSGTITAVTGAFSHLMGNSPITVASQLKFGGSSDSVEINLGITASGGDAKLLNANDIPLIDPIIGNTFTAGIQGSGRTEFGGAHEVELYAKGAVKILSTDGNQNGIGSYILIGSASISSDIANTDQHTIRFGSGSGGNLGHHPTLGEFYGGTDTVVFNTAIGHITASGNISSSGTGNNFFGGNINTLGSFNSNGYSVGTYSSGDLLLGYNNNIPITIGKLANPISLIGNTTASGDISASGDITANNLTLSGDATINGNLTFGNSTSDSVAFGAEISSSIIPDANDVYALGSSTRRWSSVFANSASFSYISASHLDLDGASLSIGGTSFTKTDVDNLKSGKSISTTATKQLVHQGDDSTFVQMKTGSPGRVIHKVSNVSLFDMQTSSFVIGDPAYNVPLKLQGSSLSISGSTTVTGSFTVTDLLNVLGNYGQTGSFSVSGSTTLDGDLNADGQVTVTDLLTVLGGFGASGSCEVSGGLTISGSNIAGSPPALMITGSTEITGSTTVDGPFAINNLLDLLANFGATGIPTGSGEGGVSSGDINLDGQVNMNDMLLLLAGMGNPNTLVTNLTIPQNTNYQLIGPEITVSQSIVVTVGTNSFFSIT